MRSTALIKWEKKLKKVLDQLDDKFEDQYGDKFHLHPVRPKRGKTANKSHDGLFNITAKFTLGYGSKIGEGYVLDLHLSTLDCVQKEFKENLLKEALIFLDSELPKVFQTSLDVEFDGKVIKIHGDLSL